MTQPDFPFGLVGMVHVRNAITSHRPVRVDDVVDLTARCSRCNPHTGGVQMDVVVASVDVALKLPLLLPSTVEYIAREADGGAWAFRVCGRGGKLHLPVQSSPRLTSIRWAGRG